MLTNKQIHQAVPPTEPQKPNVIKRQLGKSWMALHPDIRARFSHEPEYNKPMIYMGIMENMDCSKAGWLFATLTRIIGNPLTPFKGQDISMQVMLEKHPNTNGVYWHRTYYRPDKQPYTVTSIKRENSHGEMLECVGGGFGMVLRVTAENGQLHFRSTRYFWQLGKFRVFLPHIITPGATHVVHENIPSNRFRFTITMRHPFLGRTFYQTGVFKRV